MNIPFVEQINNKEVILNLNTISPLLLYLYFETCWQLKVAYDLRIYMQERYEASNNMDKICKEFRKFNFVLRLLEDLIPATVVAKWNQFELNGVPFFDYVFSTTLLFPEEFDKDKILPALIKNLYNKDKLYNVIRRIIIADREKLAI